MNLFKSVVKFVSDATPVSRFDELEEGRAAADGVVRVGEAGEILSPVNSRPCVAFYYNAFAITGSGRGGFIPRKIRSAEVYGPFVLEMEGGRVLAVPEKSDAFAGEDHRALSGQGHENFRATEDLIALGAKVRLWGRVRREGDEVVLRYRKVEVLSRALVPDSGAGRKKKRKGQAPRGKRSGR